MNEKIEAQLRESIRVKEALIASQTDVIARMAETVIDCLKAGGKLLLCGNGGSASDAQHIAGEFVGRFRRERRALPAVALSADTAALTAIANDYGYEQVFSRQVEALAAPGDVLIAFSTSGNSPNVLAAIAAAKVKGCRVLALTGGTGGKLAPAADIALVAASGEACRIQEACITAAHIVCDLAEEALAGA